ncbi:facilitated trehalose transporter Tret1-like [Cylas formicarius]|uniref:facilitated trehalose transporter Tret1-like n=1 Tax=Cylas formicarius TaxID=197179 RepID=UPI0029583BC3|nr:facilitated trehalose transporter Tret1-like [Cylas formicarius]XP_060521974.1 facilitated trehalose transporter Tret1-like [Cylas formicarius]
MASNYNLKSTFEGTGSQLVAVISGTLIAISDGMHYGWTSPIIPILLDEAKRPFETTLHECEWLETVLMAGAFCGLPLTIYFVDKIGRKNSMLLASFVSLVVWIVIGIAKNMTYLYVARFFAGMAGDMAFVAAPMYIAEISHPKIRGFLSSIIYLMMLFGIILIYTVAPFVPYYAPSILGGSLVSIELVTFIFMPESPYYLIFKNQSEKAQSSLKRLRNNVRPEEIEKELEEISQGVRRQKSEKGRPQDLLLVPSNRKGLIIMTVLNGFQHLSGISVLLMNLHLILNEAGSTYIDTSYAAIIFSCLMFLAAGSASLVMDKYGRKVLLTISATLAGFSLLVIAVYFNLLTSGRNVANVSWVPVVAVMFYAAVFKFGLGIVPIVVTSEIFPTNVKAVGMTIADSMYVIFSILSLEIYTSLHAAYGNHIPFYVFSGCSFFVVLFTIFFVPETKGKTLEEIQHLLRGKKENGEQQTTEVEA